LLRRTGNRLRVRGIFVGGVVSFLLGELFNLWFPINKKIWTSSYVFLSVGLAMLTFALCYWILDVMKYRPRWVSFFLVFGTNAIFAYTLSELIAIGGWNFRYGQNALLQVFFDNAFGWVTDPAIASLMYSASFVLVCFFGTWLLYRKKIFLKI
jgi:predicted acyltransferase